jgi:2-succinyl-5-enolpyruvyl-6-hydroxy-3-cyclohexene-1-carboxylate synthase
MPTDTYLNLRAFVDELARCGVRHAVTSPGSRNTPILLTLAREERLRTWSHIDERVAGFFALGIGKASGVPAVVTCTSGTAAANLAPAVIEAHEARVPLIVLTADRPPELRDVGAGQTIDQVKLYGSAAKWCLEVDEHPATPDRVRWMRQLACRAFAVASEAPAGVVHLNVALREPLVVDGPIGEPDPPGRPDGAPWMDVGHEIPAGHGNGAARREKRPVVVAGTGAPAGTAEACEAAGIPLLADPLSGARHGGAVIAHYDAFLRKPRPELEPDCIVRLGYLPTSKPLRQWLASHTDIPQLSTDPRQDPTASVTSLIHSMPQFSTPEPGWLETWRTLDATAAEAIDRVLGNDLTEPNVARTVAAGAEHLVVASSMPIRDVETFAGTVHHVYANRGANGIDGTVSTAYGIAAATGRPVTCLIGDVAFAYDVGGLLTHTRHPELDVTFVVLHNDGGGIFEFLPIATQTDHFEEQVATPHRLDFQHAAHLYGLSYVEAATFDDIAPTGGIVVVHTDRRENVALHRAVWDAV